MGEQQSICNEQWVKFKPLDNRRVLKDYGCFDSKVVKFRKYSVIKLIKI